jgi:hypothetical protein
MRIRQRS